MAEARLLQSSFAAGELAPRLMGRADLARYQSGLARASNMIVYPSGGVEKRGGAIFIGDPKFTDAPFRVLPFIKSVSDVVMIVVQRGTLRFYEASTRAPILSGPTPYELACPWGDDDLDQLHIWQSADVLYIADARRTAPVMRLKRAADTDWALDAMTFAAGPFLPNVKNNVLTVASDGVGGFNLSTAAALFAAGHVGALVRVKQDVNGDPTAPWVSGRDWNVGAVVENAGRIYICTEDPGFATSAAPVHDHGEAVMQTGGAGKWKYLNDGAVVLQIDAVTDATHAHALPIVDAGEFYAASLPVSTDNWQLGAFCAANGYPCTGAIAQERFALAGPFATPYTVYLSRTGGYSPDDADFKPGLGTGQVVDTDAITRAIASGQAEPIVHLVSGERLWALSTGDAHLIVGPSYDQPFTPSDIATRKFTGAPGADPIVAPVQGVAGIFYVALGGYHLVDVDEDRGASIVSLPADHIGRKLIKELAFVGAPLPLLWMRLGDGGLAALTYVPSEQQVAWTQSGLGGGGVVTSLAAAPRFDGRSDIWMCVKRTIAGAARYTIEAIAPAWDKLREPLEMACALDGAGFFDAWNTDAERHLTLSVTDAAYRRAALAADSDTFAPDDVGRTFALRLAPPAAGLDPGAAAAIARVKIDAYTDARHAAGRIMSDGPDGLAGTPTALWARMASTLSGLGRLEGLTLSALADGSALHGLIVAGGAVSLPEPVARCWIGLPYAFDLIDAPVIAAPANGPAVALPKRVNRIYVIAETACAGAQVMAPQRDSGDLLVLRATDAALDVPMAAAAGYYQSLNGGQWNASGQIRILHAEPFPFEIVGLVKEVST